MSRTGNILLVANWESDVGYAWWLMENFWVTITEHLHKKGINSILIYPKINNIPSSIQNADIHILQHQFRDLTPHGLVKLRKIIKKHSIKYIYLSDSPSRSWLYLLLKSWGVKTIIIHDHTPGERSAAVGIKWIIKSLTQRIPYYTADYYIAVTDYVYKRFIDVTCIPEYKCSCAPNGIIPIEIEDSDTNYAHNAFNIPQNKTIIVTTGRASYFKGIDFFIACANELVNKYNCTSFHFLFCGDGPNIQDFKLLVEKYSLNSYFTFAGKRNDIRKILPSCHIGLHTSQGEVGYSLSILEYMSAGLITLVPDNPSTNLATINGENGFTYKERDINSVITLLLEYMSNNKNYTVIRNNAIQFVKDNKNLDNTNKALKSIFNDILSSN